MKVAVWDTYVTRKNGATMHFDIVAPSAIQDEEVIYTFGKEYLQSKSEQGQPLTSNECQFCHMEQATPSMIESIQKIGYYIIEMQNC